MARLGRGRSCFGPLCRLPLGPRCHVRAEGTASAAAAAEPQVWGGARRGEREGGDGPPFRGFLLMRVLWLTGGAGDPWARRGSVRCWGFAARGLVGWGEGDGGPCVGGVWLEWGVSSSGHAEIGVCWWSSYYYCTLWTRTRAIAKTKTRGGPDRWMDGWIRRDND